MSQNDLGTLIATETSGAQLAALLRNWRDALHTMHAGPQRPPYAVAGTIWLDTSASLWVIKVWTGVVDAALATINPATGAMTLLDVPEPGVMMRTAAGAGPLAFLPLAEARKELSDTPLLRTWDATDLSGLTQISFDLPDGFKAFRLVDINLRSANANAGLALRIGPTAGAAPDSGSADYNNVAWSTNGASTAPQSNANANWAFLRAVYDGPGRSDTTFSDGTDASWGVQSFSSVYDTSQSPARNTVSNRTITRNAAAYKVRRLQIAFNVALAASGALRLYGIRG